MEIVAAISYAHFFIVIFYNLIHYTEKLLKNWPPKHLFGHRAEIHFVNFRHYTCTGFDHIEQGAIVDK